MQGSLGVYLQLARKQTKMCTYQNKQTNKNQTASQQTDGILD